ncbi:hypothetical protein ABPG75_008623 [Micractinium tetrahymenae]
MSSPVLVLVEDGSRRNGSGGGAGVDTSDSPRRAFASATMTLTLAILGSSVLPLPFAFSRLGILPGLGIMLAVAGGNALAGTLLLRAAAALDMHSFEGLAEAVGGRAWRLGTEVCLILLLFGNLCGDLCLLADMGSIAAQELFPGGPPGWLVAGGGRAMMAVLAAIVVFPLSCVRHMRELERIATGGILFVALLAGVFIYYAAATGFPAIASGELPLFRPALAANLPEAVGVLSFAFYLTPMLLPLLREMPAGGLGVDLTCHAVQVVTIGVAYIVYSVIGVFAAARYGLRTEGDVLVNEWLPGRWDGVLSASMTFYLSISMAPMIVTLRCQLENLLMGEDAIPPRTQQIALTGACVLAPLLVALPFPTASEKMFAVTGATAVCAVCYVLPVCIHLKLYLRTGGGGGSGSPRRGKAWRGGGMRRSGSRRSFSFEPRLAGSQAAGLGLSGDGPDLRWLLSADHHAGSAALRPPPSAAATLAALRQQQQQQQQGQQQVGRLGAGEEEEGEEGGAGGLLRGHRFTDLSLSRWLRGQSYDSFGGTGDSMPATPVSPGSYLRDSLGSYREALLAGGHAGSLESLQGWPAAMAAGGAESASAAAPLAGWEEEQQWGGGGPFATAGPGPAAAEPAPPLGGALAAVPEAAPVVPEEQEQPPGGTTAVGTAGVYPCLADAGSGGAAIASVLWHLAVPLAVLLLGLASSVSALWLAIAALRASLFRT